jgi:Na+/glutamate symporter
MSARRNFFIRSIATVAGDIAVGYALASACVWVIQSAALGLFLSFLLWLLAIAMALAFSQYLLHPATAALLSDRKLDQAIAVTTGAVRSTSDAALRLWQQVQGLRPGSRPFVA